MRHHRLLGKPGVLGQIGQAGPRAAIHRQEQRRMARPEVGIAAFGQVGVQFRGQGTARLEQQAGDVGHLAASCRGGRAWSTTLTFSGLVAWSHDGDPRGDRGRARGNRANHRRGLPWARPRSDLPRPDRRRRRSGDADRDPGRRRGWRHRRKPYPGAHHAGRPERRSRSRTSGPTSGMLGVVPDAQGRGIGTAPSCGRPRRALGSPARPR